MPTNYSPDATKPYRSNSKFSVPITSTSNSSPITIVTGSTHGLSTGDCVEVVGAQDPFANATFQVIVIDTITFQLAGSVGTLSGGAHGNVYPISVDPSFSLPADGTDLVDASSVNAPLEGSVNTIPWLYQRLGRRRLVDQYLATGSATPWTNWAGSPGSTAIADTNTPQAISANLFSPFPNYTNPPGLATNDTLEIDLCTDFIVVVGANYTVPAYATQAGIGVTFAPSTTPGLVASSVVSLGPPSLTQYATGTSYYGAVRMKCWAVASAVESFGVYLMGNVYNVTTAPISPAITITPTGVWRCQVNHYRLN
jgi:hypothetical protein